MLLNPHKMSKSPTEKNIGLSPIAKSIVISKYQKPDYKR